MPRIREAAARLVDQARDASWTHEEYLAAVLSSDASAREVPAPNSGSGPRGSRPASRWRTSTSTTLKRDTVAHLGAATFIDGAQNLMLLGPSGTGKTHLAIGLGNTAAHAGHRVLFATATEWSPDSRPLTPPADWEPSSRGYAATAIVVDEVGYIPVELDAVNLFFQLVSSRTNTPRSS